MTFGTWREEFEDWGRKEKKEKNLNHSTGNVGIRGLGSNIFPMIRPDKQMSTRKERHVYAMQFQEPWILTNSRADYQLLKTRGRAGPWLSSSPFRSTNETPLPQVRVFPDSHELNLRILSLILIALELHDLIGRGRTDRWIFLFSSSSFLRICECKSNKSPQHALLKLRRNFVKWNSRKLSS